MARPKRIWVPNCFYHIVCRGNRRDPLFRSATDFTAFLHILNQLHETYPFEIASYCLMTNHFHLQLRSKEVSISKVMALVNKRYANYYNTRYRLTGHVFEKRFFDKIIEDKQGMIEVSHYIHLNPVKAKIVKRPEAYPWSSYSFYLHPENQGDAYLDVTQVLDYYVGTDQEKRMLYSQALQEKDLV
ncbi:REP-associated tyrosine transposase [Caldifermentibacillus hisashii]|uniref:REP-associated tyrosine transposase n=1 Tax=Caldifermentibacillus hisashii TaxID=996558 RepID=UPI002DFBF644|nr:transposase [Caldifermentibacillus hisashii]MEC5271725.1 transposase [Caldifermentibacillus hisashii]